MSIFRKGQAGWISGEATPPVKLNYLHARQKVSLFRWSHLCCFSHGRKVLDTVELSQPEVSKQSNRVLACPQ
jgi:hypothetical protein